MLVGVDDFDAAYARYITRPLPIVGYRQRNPCLMALSATYDLPEFDRSVAAIRDAVNERRRQFIQRLYDLACTNRYFAVRGISTDPHNFHVDRAVGAFRLCARCCPNVVIYIPEMQARYKFKSCGHTNFCPSCWCARAMRHAQQYRQLLNACLRQVDSAVSITAHTVERFIAAPFSVSDEPASQDMFVAALELLRRETNRYCRHLAASAQQRSLRRANVSLYWCIVNIPCAGGWRSQLRQLFVRPEAEPIAGVRVNLRGTRVLRNESLVLRGGQAWSARRQNEVEDSANSFMLEFSRYPAELLTGDPDLAAVALNVAAGQRMVGGRGKLRQAGSGLLKRMRADEQTPSRRRKSNARRFFARQAGARAARDEGYAGPMGQ